MRSFIERIIRRRNPAFRFDPAVDTRIMLSFFFTQAARKLRAFRLMLLRRDPRGMLLGSSVRFSYLHKIRWGKYLKLDDHVHLSGLGRAGITLGNCVGIGAYSRVIVSTTLNNLGQHIIIGNNVGIGEFAYLGGGGGLEIGDDTIIGQYFSCHPENHVYSRLDVAIREQGVTRKGIVIGRNCWIGSKVTILDGVTLGQGCVVAAGAVVTHSFPDHCVIGGVPARLIQQRQAAPRVMQQHTA